jgi:hypothetical protein
MVLEAELVCESSLWRSLWPGRILVKKLLMRCVDFCSKGGRCDSDLGGIPVLARCSRAGMVSLIEESKDEVGVLSQGRQSSVCTCLPRDEFESSICDTARIYWRQSSSSGCYRRTGPEWHKDDEEGENARGYTGNSRPPNVTAAGQTGSSLPRSVGRAV